jgi:uncharacterized protein (TIGR02996 family)
MHEAAFLAAIRETPEDDTPRLIYADWLEEQNQSDRAQFIRAQCELAKLSVSDARRAELEDRADDLLGLHEEEWLGTPPGCLVEWVFQRGFVETLVLSATGGLLRPVEGIFAHHPVRLMQVDAVGEELTELAESPLLERVGGLHLLAPLDDNAENEEGLETLLTAPRLAGLEELSLWGYRGEDDCLPLLIQRPGAERLATLKLGDLTDEGLIRVATEPRLGSLTELGISLGRALTDRGLATLLLQPGRWKALALGRAALTVANLGRLTDCDHLKRLRCPWPVGHTTPLPLPSGLRHLEFTEPIGRVAPVSALVGMECLPNLEYLHVGLRGPGDAALRPEAVAALGEMMARLRGPVLELEVQADCLPLADLLQLSGLDRLRALLFRGQSLTSKDLRALASCTRLTSLRTLVLPSRPLTPGQVNLLADAPVLDQLHTLSLRGMKLDDTAIATIFRPGRFPRLRTLWLNANSFGRPGVEALLAWGGLPRMRSIFLSENRIDAPTARCLLGPGGVSALTQLYLGRYGVGEDRLGRASIGPFQQRLGARFTFFDQGRRSGSQGQGD